MRRTLVMLALGALASAALVAQARDSSAPNTLTPEERAAGWRLLFDGRTTAGWRGYRKTAMPEGWQVIDGALTRTGAGGDIVTVEQFGSFELAFEWTIAPAGNSGVMFRVTEERDYPWQSGPEYQILGNHVEHWLNGEKVVAYEIGSPDWIERVKKSKFAKYENWGLAPRGHIALQDHGDRVAYRNIKIRATQ